MRRKLPLIILALAVWAAACSDDGGPNYPPPAEDYEISLAAGSVTIPQDTTIPLPIEVTRGGTSIKFAPTLTVPIGDSLTGFPAETLHVEASGIVTFSNQSGRLHNIDFLNFPNNGGNSPTFPDINSWTNGDTVRLMPNPGRDSLYKFRCTRAGHIADTGFIRVHMSPRVSYTSEDYNIVNVNGLGRITGVAPGTTNIIATVSGASLTIPVTVTPVEANFIELTYLNVADTIAREKEFTIFAYPGDAQSTQLRALIRRDNDTLFCNRCIDFHERGQRYVRFISRDTAKLRVGNAANPTSPDTAGRMFAADTTSGSNGVWVVMESIDQQIRDSVKVHIRLRPIDSLEVRLDSFPEPDGDPGDKDPYPTTAIRVDSLVGLGVTYWAKAFLPKPPNSTQLPNPRYIRVLETGTGRRTTLPIVTWTSANQNYANVTSTGHVTALRWFAAANGNTAAQALVLNCTSVGPFKVKSGSTGDTVWTYAGPNGIAAAFTGPRLRTLVSDSLGGTLRTNFNYELRTEPAPQPHSRSDSLQTVYTIPGCAIAAGPGIPPNPPASPKKTIPMPGVYCTGWQGTQQNAFPLADPTSTCTVWIRAQATDPATGTLLTDKIAINIRRP